MTLPAGLAVVDQLVVGRAAERQRLERAWQGASGGERRVVLIGGEPGVGKTTLAADLARAVDRQGGIVLHGRCDEDVGTPYQPFIEAIAVHAGVERTEVVTMLRARTPEAPGADAESERLALFDAALGYLDGVAERGQLLLVLDDIHWATTPTLLLLRHLVRAPTPAPVLVVATYRDAEAAASEPVRDGLNALAREPTVERIVLGGLDEDDVAALVAERGGVSAAAIADLTSRTGGNPFFVREMLEHLREAEAAAPDPVSVPEGVREVMGRRLDRLSAETDRVVTVAAVVGASFTVPALEAVLDEHGDAVVDAVDEALAAGILVPQRGRYAFAHTLVRETILGRVSGVRRRRLHRRAAVALETLGAADAATLAHHFSEAGPDAPDGAASRHFARAATEAHDRLAYEDAAAFALRGLEALGDRAADDDDRRRLRIDLLLLRSWALRAARSDVGASKACAGEAAELARALGDPHLFAVAASSACHYEAGRADPVIPALLREAVAGLAHDGAATRSMLLSQLAVYLIINANDRDEAEATAWQALGAAEEAGDPDAEADALTALVQTLAGTGRFDERAAAVDRLVGLDGRGKSELAFGGGHMFRACMAIERGDLARVDADLTVLRGRLANRPTWYLRYATLTLSITRAMVVGRWDGAEAGQAELAAMMGTDDMAQAAWAANALVLAWERGTIAEALPMLEAIAAASPVTAFRTGLAMYASDVGRDDLARPVLDDLLGAGRVDLPIDQLYPMALVMLANAAARLGDRAAADVLRGALEPYGGRLAAFAGATFCLGAVDRYRAMVAETVGDVDAADRLYTTASELEQRCGARPSAARTALWWGRSLLPRDPDRARTLLGRAGAIAGELGMTGVSAEVSALG